jgi:UDP-N-acetyl-D-galactosamine dehydrogenase
MDNETLCEIAKVYELVIEVGVYKAPSIKVAEAAKVVENSQRDINIAFMNELAMAFDKMGIDTNAVVDAMNTKWNALGFRPGLVGGHCIGVDPYYFVYEAEKLGYHSQIIAAGRKINDGMGAFVADAAIKQMILAGKKVKAAKVVLLGITFKENCPDIRNSKVADIINRLGEYGVHPEVVDPWADSEEARHEFGFEIKALESIHDADCIIVAVAHNEFRKMTLKEIDRLYLQCHNDEKILIDVKGLFSVKELNECGYNWWRL